VSIAFNKMAAVNFEGALEKSICSYDRDIVLKPKQRECLQAVYDSRDVIVNLPSGYGKSLIYHLLPNLLACVVIVVSPLNIIQNDQLRKLNNKGIKTCRLDVQCRAVCEVSTINYSYLH